MEIEGATGTLKGHAAGDHAGISAFETAAAAPLPALCVDLDGTLVKSDTLVDSLLMLARRNPLDLLKIPSWLLKGKAALKSHVASAVTLDAAHLPYNRPLLAYLEQQHHAGRSLYLATGADTKLALRISEHLGLFHDVLASDGATNLTGGNKLASMEHRFAGHGFDYVGNARPDLPLLAHANQAMLANPNLSLQRLVKSHKIGIAHIFEDRRPRAKAFLKAIRLHQWAKNVLIFVPLLLAHELRAQAILNVLLAFFCFSLCASATYIVNDLLDIEADRSHPKKRLRPFAAGDLSAKTGLIVIAAFLAAAFFGAQFLPIAFLGWLGLYLVTTLAYSLALKRVVLVDVILLAGLYTLRLLAGGGAAHVPISPWLGAFSVFLFLSLAMVKRFSELQNARARGAILSNGRGYLLVDIEQLRSFGSASAYASVVVFALYISGPDVASLYAHPARMWLMVPLLILWTSRVWLLASRGELDEDPVIFALTDRMSLLIGAAILVIALLAL